MLGAWGAALTVASTLPALAATGSSPGWTYGEPVHVSDAVCLRQVGARAMPDLALLRLQTDPRVHAGGFLIKGMFYSRTQQGPPDAVAFRLGCAAMLDARPFLVLDFTSSVLFLDSDADGCIDAAEVLPEAEIDPADFLPALPAQRRECPPGS